jgi:hypothetical protein
LGNAEPFITGVSGFNFWIYLSMGQKEKIHKKCSVTFIFFQ